MEIDHPGFTKVDFLYLSGNYVARYAVYTPVSML
nr:MAG TPA: hypothetical protein [Bacteriophage sp.]